LATSKFAGRHARPGRKSGAVTNLDVVRESNLPAQNYKIAQFATTGNSNLGHNHVVPAKPRVVTDLHEIVDFGPFADDRIAKGTSINGRARANLYTVLDYHTADLRNLNVACRA
jgi:hypothetical protein